MGSFRVEKYRKPEYQVKVSPAKPRILQGDKMQVTIDSRYFFGEPVANAVVKYRVYHAPHYWWGDEEDESNPGMGSLPRAPRTKPQMTHCWLRRRSGVGADGQAGCEWQADNYGADVGGQLEPQDGPGLHR